MLPDDMDAKTGDTVREVLQSKHPESRVRDPSVMEDCGSLPAFVELDVTADAVEQVARRLCSRLVRQCKPLRRRT
jgi:hypothetical protein